MNPTQKNITLCYLPFHYIPFHSIPLHSIPFLSIPFHFIPFHSIPLYYITFRARPARSVSAGDPLFVANQLLYVKPPCLILCHWPLSFLPIRPDQFTPSGLTQHAGGFVAIIHLQRTTLLHQEAVPTHTKVESKFHDSINDFFWYRESNTTDIKWFLLYYARNMLPFICDKTTMSPANPMIQPAEESQATKTKMCFICCSLIFLSGVFRIVLNKFHQVFIHTNHKNGNSNSLHVPMQLPIPLHKNCRSSHQPSNWFRVPTWQNHHLRSCPARRAGPATSRAASGAALCSEGPLQRLPGFLWRQWPWWPKMNMIDELMDWSIDGLMCWWIDGLMGWRWSWWWWWWWRQ